MKSFTTTSISVANRINTGIVIGLSEPDVTSVVRVTGELSDNSVAVKVIDEQGVTRINMILTRTIEFYRSLQARVG